MGTGQDDPSEHSPHYVRTNSGCNALSSSHLSPVPESGSVGCPRSSAHLLGRGPSTGGACVALESYFKVFAQSLQGFGIFFNPSACWELNQLGLLTNAGNLHSEERISPNQMPCLIRAVDTDNAVTGAGAIYLGLMSTDKSAG